MKYDFYFNEENEEIIRFDGNFEVWNVEEKKWKRLPMDNYYLIAFFTSHGIWYIKEISEEDVNERIKKYV